MFPQEAVPTLLKYKYHIIVYSFANLYVQKPCSAKLRLYDDMAEVNKSILLVLDKLIPRDILAYLW